MARKKMAKKTSPGSAPLPGWVWMVTGLMIGLFVAFLVHLKDNYKGVTIEPTAEQVKPQQQDARAVRKTEPEAVPPPERTRFDFYTILPEMEIAIPDDEIESEPSRSSNPALKQPGKFVLQAGSFKTVDQADRMKASLALLGIEAQIQSVTINNNETWHRVRLGPYDNVADLNRVRSRLRQNNIDAILLKLKI